MSFSFFHHSPLGTAFIGLALAVGVAGSAQSDRSATIAPGEFHDANDIAASDVPMPQRLVAYKTAYLETVAATTDARALFDQYQSITAMSDAQFAQTYPGLLRQAETNRLAIAYNQAVTHARLAEATQARLLAEVTNGTAMTEAQLAELQGLLGL